MSQPSRFGKYQLVRRIGVGGMAEVYEASLIGPGGFSKRLALKLLLPRLQRQSDLIAMFIDEAGIAAGLDHPNIVAVYEFGENDGTYFMAMEYIDGWELTDVEQCCLEAGRPIPVPLAAYVVRELCRGLAYIHAHERGIVHRDVTPHNVFISRLGQVKLADFGIAKAAARRTHTAAGHIKGKLAYLAPEQATSEPVTARTDVYAAGLILFELLTGRRLIQADTEVEHITLAMNPPRVAPSSLRPEAAPLDAVVARALERHPVMRFPGAALMATHLDRFLETAPVRSEDLAAFVAEVTANLRPTNQVTPLPDGAVATELAAGTPAREAAPPSLPPLPRHRLGLWMGGGLLAAGLLGAGGALVWSGARHTSRPPRTDAGRPARLDRTAAPIDARTPSSPDRTAADSELRSHPVPRRHRPDRPVAKTGSPRSDAAAQAPSGAAEPPRARRQRLQASVEALTQQARGRGLFPGDDDEADRAALQGRRSLQAGALDEADAAVGRLRARVQMFRIDRTFAERKLRRLERAIAAASGRLPEADRQRLGTVSQSILRLIMEGRLVEASAQMSRTLSEL